MSEIAKLLQEIKTSLPTDVTLIAVSKTKPIEAMQEAYNAGQRHFGENKIQEMAEKHDVLPKDIHWHMIGHVQRNKVKYMAEFVHLIHGIDSPRLLEEIDKRAAQHNRTIDCLFQLHIAEESTKFGFDRNELLDFRQSDTFKNLKNIRIRGLMGMSTNTDNSTQVRREFNTLHTLFNELKSDPLLNSIDTLSMGMSGDYELAIECGSNMVRVGSAIFGARNYA